MRTVDTRGSLPYSPLVPMLRAFYTAAPGERLNLVTDDEAAFTDMKEFLAEQGIGFREVYDDGFNCLQFTLPAQSPER